LNAWFRSIPCNSLVIGDDWQNVQAAFLLKRNHWQRAALTENLR
jgi:hypothetical protein